MAKTKKQIAFERFRKNGYKSLDIALAYSIAREESRKMETEANERAFLYMLAIPLNVLADREIITHENAEEYINDVISLYKSVQDKIVSDKDLADLLHEYTGMTITADWIKDTEKREI